MDVVTRAEWIVWAMIVALACGVYLLARVLGSTIRAWKRSIRPNWYEAARLFAAPKSIPRWGGWTTCYVRETSGAALFYCQMKLTEEGVLMRDPYWGPGPIFVPWCAFSNPKKTRVPLYVSLLEEEWVELGIEGSEIVVAVPQKTYGGFA